MSRACAALYLCLVAVAARDFRPGIVRSAEAENYNYEYQHYQQYQWDQDNYGWNQTQDNAYDYQYQWIDHQEDTGRSLDIF